MNETRLTAALPRLDVEIVRRRDEDLRAETVTIRLRATPTFHALADHLAANILPAAAPIGLASPFTWWAQWMAAAWRPWLAAVLPPQGQDPAAD